MATVGGVSAWAEPAAVESEQESGDKNSKKDRDALLKSLDLLNTEQATRKQNKTRSDLSDFRLELNSLPDIRPGGFRDQSGNDGQEAGQGSYFYLNDGRETNQQSPSGLLNLPDFSSLLAPTGSTRSVLGQRPTGGTEGRVGFLFGSKQQADGSTSRGVEVALQSAYRLMNDYPHLITNGAVSDQLADREYDLGLSIGYSGFNLDASLQRDWSPFKTPGEGYELGFSYQATAWSARLAWNAYKAGEDLEGIENEQRDFISLEVGANLKLSNRFGLTGGVRYFDYGSHHLVTTEQGESSQMIFIGGRLRF